MLEIPTRSCPMSGISCYGNRYKFRLDGLFKHRLNLPTFETRIIWKNAHFWVTVVSFSKGKIWHLPEQICRKAKITLCYKFQSISNHHKLFQVKKQQAPVHKGPHKHSLHGPVFQTRHWVGHTRSCDVKTLQNMDPWWGMRKWEVEGLMCFPEEQYFCCYSRWPVLSYSGKSINKLHSF